MNEFLDQVAIILVEPKYPENIGSSARVAANMGISNIIVVRDDIPDKATMLKLATHHAAEQVQGIQYVQDLKKALAPFSWVVGTSARKGRQRRSMLRLRPVIQETLPRLQNNRVAFLFGAEDRGLANDHLKHCNLIATIPTADFSSLNLAQSVAIVLYELFSGLQEMSVDKRQPAAPLFKQAASEELEGMYSLVEKTLQQIDYLKETDYNHWMQNIRQFLGRVGLRSREVKLIKGLCRQVLWLTEKISSGGQRGS
jgi:tRNA/rRNA methyltransferase